MARDPSPWLVPGALDPVSYPATAAPFGWPDLVITALGGATALTSAIVGPDRINGPRGGWWFDEDVRNALLPDDYSTQLAFRDTSDVLLGLSFSYVFMGDALINATWLRRSPEVGRELALIDAEVAALTLGLQQLTANVVSRERPYGRTCGTDELDERSSQCTSNDRYLSHFSGHASTTFALAAVTCSHHSHIPLSGGQAWIPCLSGFVTAAATATFRVVGDMHYATDVLMGAAVGTLIGFTVPALHYGIGGWTPRSPGSVGEFRLVPTLNGISLGGTW
ncbi:MAG TPA: phosphatase PAP2 family protein [Polyangiaceae bacterium]|nr:phosphatase PAP2 family protein [Polyangiaceae bacterium]